MVGVAAGVAPKKTAEEPRALFTHCHDHALKLAVSDTVKRSPPMKDCLYCSYESNKACHLLPNTGSTTNRRVWIGELWPKNIVSTNMKLFWQSVDVAEAHNPKKSHTASNLQRFPLLFTLTMVISASSSANAREAPVLLLISTLERAFLQLIKIRVRGDSDLLSPFSAMCRSPSHKCCKLAVVTLLFRMYSHGFAENLLFSWNDTFCAIVKYAVQVEGR